MNHNDDVIKHVIAVFPYLTATVRYGELWNMNGTTIKYESLWLSTKHYVVYLYF